MGCRGHLAPSKPVTATQPTPPGWSGPLPSGCLPHPGAGLRTLQVEGWGRGPRLGCPEELWKGLVRMGQGEPARSKDENISYFGPRPGTMGTRLVMWGKGRAHLLQTNSGVWQGSKLPRQVLGGLRTERRRGSMGTLQAWGLWRCVEGREAVLAQALRLEDGSQSTQRETGIGKPLQWFSKFLTTSLQLICGHTKRGTV